MDALNINMKKNINSDLYTDAVYFAFELLKLFVCWKFKIYDVQNSLYINTKCIYKI